LDGPGTIRLTGSSNNTVAGTVITDGTVELAKTGGTNAVGNDLLVGTTGSSTGPTVRWLESFQIPTSLPVRFRSGVLDLNDKVASFGGLNASGGGSMNIVTGAGTMGVQGNMISFEGARVDFNGNIDLTGASRNFSARGSALLQPNFTNWTITGTI